jgi:hypothetical protein
VCDVRSRQLLSRPVWDSETRCSLDDSLPGRAWLVTAGFGALGTMKSFAREENTVRCAQQTSCDSGRMARADMRLVSCTATGDFRKRIISLVERSSARENA